MSDLTPALDAALAGPCPTVFGAFSIALPGYNLNLLDGSGQLSFEGRNYVGRDAIYGVLASCDTLSDGRGDQAPSIKVTLIPASDAAAADLASPAVQGSQTLIHVGVLDRATGLPIPDPHLLFFGELDVPILSADETGRDLQYTIVSVLEHCLADDEGQRLSPGRQRSIYPSDAGLDDVTGVTKTVYWGVAGNNSSSITYGRGTGMAAGLSPWGTKL